MENCYIDLDNQTIRYEQNNDRWLLPLDVTKEELEKMEYRAVVALIQMKIHTIITANMFYEKDMKQL